MGVLGSAVQQDQFRVPVLPHQRAQSPAAGHGVHVGEGPPHCRRAVKGQAVLCGVLVEQPELVVVDPAGHRFSSPAKKSWRVTCRAAHGRLSRLWYFARSAVIEMLMM